MHQPRSWQVIGIKYEYEWSSDRSEDLVDCSNLEGAHLNNPPHHV